MGYIKKLKNNELVGGTDKTTIYPVTSAEAVFEEVSDREFKSQKYLNNHITNERIVDNTIENDKLKDDTIDMGKLNTQLKTIIQNAYDASWKVKEEPFSLETKYDANDVVYDPDTNSSYVSLTADNQGNPVKLEDEEEVNPYWRLVINGISAVQATEEIEATKNELIDYIQENLKDQVDEKITDANVRIEAAEQYAQGVISGAEQTARSISGIVYQTVAATPNYTDTIPVQNKAVTAQIGYYTCTGGSGATIIVDDTDAAAFTPVKGGQVKILMTQKSTVTSGNVQLQFGSVTATKKVLVYNEDPVSSSNTWEVGEVISVYYDGTKYHASNAQGGSNKKIDAYLLGGLRTLAVGQVYEENEAVKTTDKQLLRLVKNIEGLSLTKEIAVGDLRVSGSNTYLAQASVKKYTASPSTPYSDGDYAIGSPSGAIIQVSVDDEAIALLEEPTTITVVINDVSIDVVIESSMTAATIATAIYTAFGTQDEWSLTDNEDGTLTLLSKVAKNTIPTLSANVGETGVSIAFAEESAYAGSLAVSQFNNNSWTVVNGTDYLASNVWSSVTVEDIISLATKQDTDIDRLLNEPIVVINVNKGELLNGYIGGYGNWTTGGTHYLVPVNYSSDGTYIIETGSEDVYYAWLKGTETTGTPSYSDGATVSKVIKSGSRVELKVPNSQTNYLFISNKAGTYWLRPKSVRYRYKRFTDYVAENIETLYNDVEAIGVENKDIPQDIVNDFVISDENNNDIVQFKNGHIRTKNFNSEDINFLSLGVFDFIKTKYAGKRCAIVGDSISTFSGTSPSSYANFYPGSYGLTLGQIWWRIVCKVLEMTYTNCSWSGSKVTGAPKAASASAGCSDQRITDIGRNGDPDIILFFIGCNDWGHNISLGSWTVDSDIVDDSEYTASQTISGFKAAYSLMLYKAQTKYPNAKLFCCTILDDVQRDNVGGYPSKNSGNVSTNTWNNNIKEIATAMGISVIDMHACGLNYANIHDYVVDQGLHPNAAGHALMANKVISELMSK